MPRPGSVKWPVAAAVAVAVLWRLIVAVWLVPAWEQRTGTASFPDDYPVLARSLLDEGTLGFSPHGGPHVTTIRGPGFPLFLAAGIFLGGDDGRWLGFWSAVPALVLAVFLTLAVRRRYGVVPAACAFAFLALHPLAAFTSARVMSDEFSAACCFGGLLLWESARRVGSRQGTLRAIAAGSLFALGILTRSVAVLALLGIVVIECRRRPAAPRLLALLAVVALLPPIFWSIRTSRLEGRPVFVHSLAAYNFWVGEGFQRYGHGWARPGTWAKVTDLLEKTGDIPDAGERPFHYSDLDPEQAAKMERSLGRAAVAWVLRNPLSYAWRVLNGLWRFWAQAQSPARTAQYALLILPALLFALPAVLPGRGSPLRNDPLGATCVLTIATHMLAYALLMAMARCSVQVFPHVAWLLAAGVARMQAPGSSRIAPRPGSAPV